MVVVGADGVAPWWAGRQRILNARGVPARFTRGPAPIAVTARVCWSDDGEERLDARATAWTVPLVLVEIADPRSAYRGVWLPATDVDRR